MRFDNPQQALQYVEMTGGRVFNGPTVAAEEGSGTLSDSELRDFGITPGDPLRAVRMVVFGPGDDVPAIEQEFFAEEIAAHQRISDAMESQGWNSQRGVQGVFIMDVSQ